MYISQTRIIVPKYIIIMALTAGAGITRIYYILCGHPYTLRHLNFNDIIKYFDSVTETVHASCTYSHTVMNMHILHVYALEII